jgi:mono/diheme cytochrome c family protein
MKSRKILLLLLGVALVAVGIYGVHLIWRGFSTANEPSLAEKTVARLARDLSIPRNARNETNPWTATPELLNEARNNYLDRCGVCHGPDGSGQTTIGRNLYPKVPDLRAQTLRSEPTPLLSSGPP